MKLFRPTLPVSALTALVALGCSQPAPSALPSTLPEQVAFHEALTAGCRAYESAKNGITRRDLVESMSDTISRQAESVSIWTGILTKVSTSNDRSQADISISAYGSAFRGVIQRESPLDGVVGRLAIGDTVAFTVSRIVLAQTSESGRFCRPSFEVTLTGITKVPWKTVLVSADSAAKPK